MNELTPHTVTITGLDEVANESLSRKIAALVRQEGYRAVVRVEQAEQPHHYDSEDLGHHMPHSDPSLIQLMGNYSVEELDAISFKLRGGR